MDTPHEGFPLLVVFEGIEHTEDGRLLVDGVELAPGRYRVRLTDDVDGPETVLTVPDPGTDDVLFGDARRLPLTRRGAVRDGTGRRRVPASPTVPKTTAPLTGRPSSADQAGVPQIRPRMRSLA
ncbi:hypothetical protein [Streptosporangium canum]|uniref:hypothetical protein n=1 Tax=Streptosporangium canum TaxID=324952 RepID=UPI0037A6DA7B